MRIIKRGEKERKMAQYDKERRKHERVENKLMLLYKEKNSPNGYDLNFTKDISCD